MKKNIYFSASIRGGRNDALKYKKCIEHLNTTDHVLTEQVGDIFHSTLEQSHAKDQEIYKMDMQFLKDCDFVIAECSTPSLGVGYELAIAEQLKKNVYILYNPTITQLSAMLKGNAYFKIYPYQNDEELIHLLDTILKREHQA